MSMSMPASRHRGMQGGKGQDDTTPPGRLFLVLVLPPSQECHPQQGTGTSTCTIWMWRATGTKLNM
ncbi:hypothetical protein BO70DRAFT_366320 [Aspergillus heteromorphus CBS 117.55]|uniref:Uncharacterized protein n=1 Tax=Aspergillus heteromorphus CBS 117.55 TaxID=1448321 RepID=A0A317UYK5_9EURO|nr:uncharacterized protein BO70DRAFT_366320 [Aspergillus heteromorphus CBS 117.55]PWY67143.1 hypothetical protein BO70DRAFT_366320 [Aspergillus heteromorphus CBS 117.55]